MIQSYKKQYKIADQYDTIIIGSGISALSCAAILSKRGQKVLILERHYTAGGFTHVFKRNSYEWDVGIHYIGSVGKKDSVLRKLFDYVSDKGIDWADMGEVYDSILIGNQRYDFVKGVGNWKAKMLEYFPKEEKALDRYLNLIFKASNSNRNFFIEKTFPTLWSKLLGWILRYPFLKYAKQSTYDVIRSITNNDLLVKVLTAQYGDYGLPPKKSSFAMHAALVRHYFSGGYFPVGGSSVICDAIDKVLTNHGSAILVSAEVREILISNNKAVGVQMKDGNCFYAKNIVSSAGIFTTFNTLLSSSILKQFNLGSITKSLNPSVAHAGLYIGLNGSPEELQLPRNNFWIYPEEISHDEAVRQYTSDIQKDFPVVYISFPSAKDPDWSNRYPNKSTIDIITLLPFEIVQNWENDRWKKRGHEYETLKTDLAKRLLEILFDKMPHLREKVDYYELSTGLSTKHFVNYQKGELYGLDHDTDRFLNKHLRPRTAIKGLYLTGQDITTAGVGGAAFSAVLTASVICNSNVMKDILDQ